MKKILAAFLPVLFLAPQTFCQDGVRGSAIGISFFKNDFLTPQRIRSTSLSNVFSNRQWAKFGETDGGIAISYFKGLNRHIDFAGTLAGSSVNLPFPNRPAFPGDALLLEADASVNLKMLPENYWVIPYLSV